MFGRFLHYKRWMAWFFRAVLESAVVNRDPATCGFETRSCSLAFIMFVMWHQVVSSCWFKLLCVHFCMNIGQSTSQHRIKFVKDSWDVELFIRMLDMRSVKSIASRFWPWILPSKSPLGSCLQPQMRTTLCRRCSKSWISWRSMGSRGQPKSTPGLSVFMNRTGMDWACLQITCKSLSWTFLSLDTLRGSLARSLWNSSRATRRRLTSTKNWSNIAMKCFSDVISVHVEDYLHLFLVVFPKWKGWDSLLNACFKTLHVCRDLEKHEHFQVGAHLRSPSVCIRLWLSHESGDEIMACRHASQFTIGDCERVAVHGVIGTERFQLLQSSERGDALGDRSCERPAGVPTVCQPHAGCLQCSGSSSATRDRMSVGQEDPVFLERARRACGMGWHQASHPSHEAAPSWSDPTLVHFLGEMRRRPFRRFDDSHRDIHQGPWWCRPIAWSEPVGLPWAWLQGQKSRTTGPVEARPGESSLLSWWPSNHRQWRQAQFDCQRHVLQVPGVPKGAHGTEVAWVWDARLGGRWVWEGSWDLWSGKCDNHPSEEEGWDVRPAWRLQGGGAHVLGEMEFGGTNGSAVTMAELCGWLNIVHPSCGCAPIFESQGCKD